VGQQGAGPYDALVKLLLNAQNETNRLMRAFFFLMNRKRPVDLYYIDRMAQRARNIRAYGYNNNPTPIGIQRDLDFRRDHKRREYYQDNYGRKRYRLRNVNGAGGITKRGTLIQPHQVIEEDDGSPDFEDGDVPRARGRPPKGFNRTRLLGFMGKIKNLQKAIAGKIK